MALFGIFIGNEPVDLVAYEEWLGSEVDFVRASGGRANWDDLVNSLGWVGWQFRDADRDLYWTVPMIPNGASLAAGARGEYDHYYVQAAKKVLEWDTGTGPVHVRLGEEFNGNWMPWAAAGKEQDFIGTFRNIVDAFRTVSDRFVFEWNVNVGDLGMNPEDAYPGDDYVDVIGMDFYYNIAWDPKDPAEAWEYMVSRKYGLQWLEDFAEAHGKPTAYSEWGVNSDNAQAYIQAAASWFETQDVLYHSYWDSDYDFAGTLSKGSYPSTAAAFKALFGDTADDGAGDGFVVESGGVLSVGVADSVLAEAGMAYVLTEAPTHGALSIAADGSFVYVPDANFLGNDSFSYRVAGGSGSTTVLLTVQPPQIPAASRPAASGAWEVWHGGSGGDDRMTGTNRSDNMSGGAGADTMIGGAGDDIYTVDLPTDVVTEAAGGGIDTISSYAQAFLLPANVEHLKLVAAYAQSGTGNALANAIEGNGADNRIDGGGGNDWLAGGGGRDVFVARLGGGHDTVADFAPGTDRVALVSSGIATFAEAMAMTVDTAAGARLWLPDGSSLLLQDVKKASLTSASYEFSGRLAPSLGSMEQHAARFGSTGAEVLLGTAGSDHLDGRGGGDTLRGGAGDDHYILRSGDRVSEADKGGIDLVRSYAGYQELAVNVEHLHLVSGQGQIGIGNGLGNRIVGGVGADKLDGRTGNDWLTGGDGGDTFKVGVAAGNDVIIDFAAGAGGDVLDLSAHGFSGLARVKAAMTATSDGVLVSLGNGATVLLLGTEIGAVADGNIRLGAVGPALASKGWESWIGGTAGNDVLTGDGRNNNITGDQGFDTMSGAAGDDLYTVDWAEDVVVERPGEGIDTINSYAKSYRLPDHVEHLRIVGSTGQSATGNGLDNRVTGGVGADSLEGGGGQDWLTGGAGRDVFVFKAGAGDDVVTDFQLAGTPDAVDLRGFGLDWAKVKASIHAGSGGAEIDLPDGGGLTLLDIAPGTLAASHFLL